MNTTYAETLDYLYSALPMFHRIGAAALKPDLTNTIRLCDALGNPQHAFKSIHIAGTNGKGSTSHMLASVLQEANYKTGLYTSPHLKSFTERIRVNGEEVSEAFVIDFVNRVVPLIDEIKPSFFEITVAMAFDYFAKQKVDVAVIETGLGGRLDSTNIITPVLSVITNISWDHKDILGDTLEKIASEKAGIIKPHVPVVISQRQKNIEHVFIAKAKECDAEISFASDNIAVAKNNDGGLKVKSDKISYDDLQLPLKGNYQVKNLPGVLKSVEVLNTHGFSISNDALQNGLVNVISNTQLKGRWQILRDQPLMICDTGHNIDGITEIVQQIQTITYDKLHMVIGMVKDKDITEILQILPVQATYYFCQSKLPRALDAHILAEKAAHCGLHGTVIPDVNEAKRVALKNASENDLIFIGGSTFVVAELDEI